MICLKFLEEALKHRKTQKSTYQENYRNHKAVTFTKKYLIFKYREKLPKWNNKVTGPIKLTKNPAFIAESKRKKKERAFFHSPQRKLSQP